MVQLEFYFIQIPLAVQNANYFLRKSSSLCKPESEPQCYVLNNPHGDTFLTPVLQIYEMEQMVSNLARYLFTYTNLKWVWFGKWGGGGMVVVLKKKNHGKKQKHKSQMLVIEQK